MTERLRIGVVGCGSIAFWKHLRIAGGLAEATLVAIADPDAEARGRAEKLTGISAHASAEELLARADVDAVVVTVPTHLHADVAVAACESGKHLYIEKPLATSARDGRRVADAARRAGVTAMLGFNRRYHPLYVQARRLLREGRIGRVHSVQTSFTEFAAPDAMPAWKKQRASGGGVLLDLASHHIDLMRWLLADDVASVFATLESEATEHDSARLQLKMRGGAVVQSFFSCRAATSDAIEFHGEGGSLRIDRHRWLPSLRLPRRFGYGTRSARLGPSRDVFSLWTRRMVQPSADPSYQRALEDFVHLVRGDAVSAPTIDDGLRTLEVVEAAELSASRQAPIDLGPPPSDEQPERDA